MPGHSLHRFFFLKAVPALALLPAIPRAEEPEPDSIKQGVVAGTTLSFRNDVMPVLTKMGCNLGACHGAQTGKADLALSLRGEDPAKDHAVLINSFIDDSEPEKSYLLRKPAADGVEHEGGKRFGADSEAYRILRDWIAEGARLEIPNEPHLVKIEATPAEKIVFEPETEIQLGAVAHFSDGSTRDVRQWAVYEPSTLKVEAGETGLVRSLKPGETTVSVRFLGKQTPVRLAFVPERPGFVWSDPPARNFIDEHLQAKWKTHRLNPSGLCDDATFIRRSYLDLTGVIPAPDEARRFIADKDPEKRARLIDALLERGEFADFWSLKWADLLRVEEKVLDRKGVAVFHGWIRQSIAENKPLDQFAREILTARGDTYQAAPSNYYRALREPAARAEAAAQVFLGTRLNCAKCHNHPFEKWTMDDYYEFAAIFDGLDYEIVENKRKDKNDKNMFIGGQVVKRVDDRKFKHPRTGNPPKPRLLGVTESIEDPGRRFEELADWMTSAENPLFARVQANRIWFHLMGRGLVDPVDDFRATNPPVNPALLDALTREFVSHGFDLRHVIRVICNSRAYQLSSVPNPLNADDTINFTRQIPRRLGAEQLLDSAHRALGVPARFAGYEGKADRASQVQGVEASYRGKDDTHADRFLKLFGKPPRLTNSDSERAGDTSLAQILELTSGETLNSLLTSETNTLSRLLDAGKSNTELVEGLYWAILTRQPSPEENGAMDLYLANSADPRLSLEDLAWSMLNAKEFILRK